MGLPELSTLSAYLAEPEGFPFVLVQLFLNFFTFIRPFYVNTGLEIEGHYTNR